MNSSVQRVPTGFTPIVGGWSAGSEQLAGLLAFASSGERQFAALVGRGGIGKSRLLRELAVVGEREGAATFRFAARNAEIRPGGFRAAPARRRARGRR